VDIYQVIKEPHITEKTSQQKGELGQISFEVHRGANKIEIKKAVESLLGIKVLKVRTINVRGKSRRVGRNIGRRSDWKKAIVTVAPGENMEVLEGL
jgi:large subunit ribosomal protein L23